MNKSTKLILGFSIFFVTIFLIILILPFVVDLSRFKPQIQAAVSDKVNAKIDFTSIRLEILNGFGFKLENVSIENTDPLFLGKKIIEVKEVKFKSEFLPLLSGKIIGNIEILSPRVQLLKKGDRNNIISLLKHNNVNNYVDKNSIKNSNEPINVPTVVEQVGKSKNNDFSKNILVKSLIIKEANISFVDLSLKKEPLIIQNLNLNVSNIGIDKDVKIIIYTDLNLRNTEYHLQGAIVANLVLNTSLENLEWSQTNFKGDMNLDKMEISYQDVFLKKSGIPFQAMFSGQATPNSLIINNFDIKLQNLKTIVNAKIQDFKILNSKINIDLSSEDVSRLTEILPKHQSLLFKGDFNFNSAIVGPLSDTNALSSITKLSANLYNSDIKLIIKEDSLSPLKGSLNVQSNRLNLMEILKPFKKIAGSVSKDNKKSTEKNKSINQENTAINNHDIIQNNENIQSSHIDKNADDKSKEFVLDEKQRKMLVGADFSVKADMSKLIYDNMEINNISLDSNLNNFIINIIKLNLNAFKGKMFSKFIVNLFEFPIRYKGNMSFNRIELQQLFKYFMNKEESPIEGDVDLNFNFNGVGTTRNTISKNLNAKGNFSFYSGKLNVKSLTTLASEQLQKFTENMNIPSLNNKVRDIKKIDFGENKTRSLENTRGDFEIKNGKIILNNKITSDQGDLKFDATVGLDESLNGTAIYTANKLIKDKVISIDKNIAYLFDTKGNLQLNLILGGTISNPSVKLDPKNLQENIIKNAAGMLKERLKDEIKNNSEFKKLEDKAKDFLKDKGINLNNFGF